MRTLAVKVRGITYDMPVTYRAGQLLADKVGDPLQLAVRSHNEGVNITIGDVVNTLHVGATAAGCELTADEFGDAILDEGLENFIGVAVEYLSAFVSAAPSKPVPRTKKKKNTKK